VIEEQPNQGGTTSVAQRPSLEGTGVFVYELFVQVFEEGV